MNPRFERTLDASVLLDMVRANPTPADLASGQTWCIACGIRVGRAGHGKPNVAYLSHSESAAHHRALIDWHIRREPMNKEALTAACKEAQRLAAENPGRYGGRYVARVFNRTTRADEYVVLGDDDPELYRDSKHLDIMAQVTSRAVHPIGSARRFLNADGSVAD